MKALQLISQVMLVILASLLSKWINAELLFEQ